MHLATSTVGWHKYGEMAFPIFTNANKYALLTLGSDNTLRDDVEIRWGGVESVFST